MKTGEKTCPWALGNRDRPSPVASPVVPHLYSGATERSRSVPAGPPRRPHRVEDKVASPGASGTPPLHLPTATCPSLPLPLARSAFSTSHEHLRRRSSPLSRPPATPRSHDLARSTLFHAYIVYIDTFKLEASATTGSCRSSSLPAVAIARIHRPYCS